MESVWARNPALLTISCFSEPNYLTHAVPTLVPRPPPPSLPFRPLQIPPRHTSKTLLPKIPPLTVVIPSSRQDNSTRDASPVEPSLGHHILPGSQLMDCRTGFPLGMFSCLSFILKLPLSLFRVSISDTGRRRSLLTRSVLVFNPLAWLRPRGPLCPAILYQSFSPFRWPAIVASSRSLRPLRIPSPFLPLAPSPSLREHESVSDLGPPGTHTEREPTTTFITHSCSLPSSRDTSEIAWYYTVENIMQNLFNPRFQMCHKILRYLGYNTRFR